MKRLTSLVLSVTTTAMLAAPLLTQAAAPQAIYLTDFGFTHQNKPGSVSFTCYGDRIGTGYPEILPNVSICDGITEMNVSFNGNVQAAHLIKSFLSPADQTAEYEHREDQGVVWMHPEVVHGTAKQSLLIRSDIVDSYTGITGYQVYPTYLFDFKTKKLEQIDPTPENVLWNKAGTKGLFIPTTCGGAGCFSTAHVRGINLTNGTVTNVTTMQASNEGSPTQGPNIDVNGNKLTTWQSIRWINDSKFEVTYMTVDGKKHSVRKNF